MHFLLLDCRARACAKGTIFHRHLYGRTLRVSHLQTLQNSGKPLQLAHHTVGFHNFNLRIFNLRVSNPNKLIVDDFLTRCRISMCQGLGQKKNDEISEIDCNTILCPCMAGGSVRCTVRTHCTHYYAIFSEVIYTHCARPHVMCVLTPFLDSPLEFWIPLWSF